MSEVHEGDTARFTYVAQVYKTGDHPSFVSWAKSGDMVVAVPADATIEVLERAKQECGATEGATGITCQLARFHAAAIDHEGMHDPATATHDGIGYRLTVRWPWNEWDRDAKAVGGEFPEVSGAGVPYPKPAADMCTLDDCVAAPRCSSGATVWHTRTPECGPQKSELRVFRSDGPEPPQDVKALLDAEDTTRMPYLLRIDDGWVWSSVLYEVQTDDDKPRPWSSRAVTAMSRELRELIP